MIKFIESVNFAVEGFFHVIKTQRNMRIHFLVSALVVLIGIYLNLTGVELMIVLIAITFVLVAEMINTAIEFSIDLITKEKNPVAGMVKDICAGAVLVAAVTALTVFYFIFSKYLNAPLDSTLLRIRQAPWHLTFIAFIIVLTSVIFLKVLLKRGRPMEGGMPSGHAAIAFSIWTVISFYATHNLVIILTFVLAFLLARSRIDRSIHSVWEVIAGALLGVLFTALIFQILN